MATGAAQAAPDANRPRHVSMGTSQPPRGSGAGLIAYGRFASRYFAGIGLSGRSESHITVTIHQRPPCCISWIELMPRAKGFSSAFARLDSYVLKTCMMVPNASIRLATSCSKNPFNNASLARVM